MKSTIKETPSGFYKMIRPEYFSDSEITYEIQLTRELLAYELNQLSTNQKQDQFESFCRRLAEKFISPNLIPQVGPTGGGDGKTDFETYPVSTYISDRWFIPENGWNKDEKWAFAISAKKEWKSKVDSDVKKIMETGRDYTRIYFMTNQTPSSKEKKERQDKFKNEYKIEVIIFDQEWILEKVYGSDLIDLAVNALNLSDIYKKKVTTVGKNDADRIKKLAEIEEKINNPNRYFEYDFQIVEDALEASILSRMLEKPREEVEGKFDRAVRFCKKLKNNRQFARIHYERAWTYLNWYNDYPTFVAEYKDFKSYISEASSISEIELYINLINLLRGLSASENCNLSDLKLDIKKEIGDLLQILDVFEKHETKPCSALIAKTHKSIQGLIDSLSEKKNPVQFLKDLSNCLTEGAKYLEYSFENYKRVIEQLGNILPNNQEFDNLIDSIASISEKRLSEITAGRTFLTRALQKLPAKYYKESIVYFGKAVMKLAKEESQDGIYLSLMGLSQAYEAMGLLWASNCCLVSATSISLRPWHQKGIISKKTYSSVRRLTFNELLIGRIPSFLTWHELYLVISSQVDVDESEEEIPTNELIDGCLSVRIVNTEENEAISYLPDLLEKHTLYSSQNTTLYRLGYIDLILKDYKDVKVKDENDLDKYFEVVAQQPFKSQMLYDTNFLAEEDIKLSSTILGCKFNLYFKKDTELLLAAETLLAFFESFLATSLTNIYPSAESVTIELVKNPEIEYPRFLEKESSSEYSIEINEFNFSKSRDKIWGIILEFIGNILSKNFFINSPKEYLENLFKKEEVHERLSLIFEHRNVAITILGNESKLFFDDWFKEKSLKTYSSQRKTPISFNCKTDEVTSDKEKDSYDPDNVSHDKRKIFSIIETNLWDQAKWIGFGMAGKPSSMAIIMAFENSDAGEKIFDNWIKRIGNEDKNEEIKITIIKGVDKNNPYWYRIHIGSNVDHTSIQSGNIYIATSRFHEMNVVNHANLDNLIKGYNFFKQYEFCPAKISTNGTLKPNFDKAILKKALFIKNAWEIGEKDMECVAIKKGDSPIIPDGIDNIPVLNVLKNKKINY